MAAGCSGSGFSLSYNDYDDWNTNTNVSSHLCNNDFCSTGPATWQKMIFLKRALVL